MNNKKSMYFILVGIFLLILAIYYIYNKNQLNTKVNTFIGGGNKASVSPNPNPSLGEK